MKNPLTDGPRCGVFSLAYISPMASGCGLSPVETGPVNFWFAFTWLNRVQNGLQSGSRVW